MRNEQATAKRNLFEHVVMAKHHIELILEDLGWPNDPALHAALDRLAQLKEQAS